MRFFFYGTLLKGSDNAVAHAAHALLKPLGEAWIEGRLLAIPDPDGWFPALVSGTGRIRGELYSSGSGFGTSDLARLDAYEEFDPEHPGGSLYVRHKVLAQTGTGTHVAQAYRFNRRPPPDAIDIAGGDFRQWLRDTGLPPFTGARNRD